LMSVFAKDGVVFYYTVAAVGRYADHRFTPERMSILDVGGHVAVGASPLGDEARRLGRGMEGGTYYAAQTFADASGRRIAFGWIQEARPRAASERAGWAGAMALPRELKLDR